MSLFSFLRKNKQESAPGESTFYSRAEEDSKAVRSRAKRRGSKVNREDEALDPLDPAQRIAVVGVACQVRNPGAPALPGPALP